MSDSRSKRVLRVERELFETLSHFLIHGLAEPLPSYASLTAVEVNPNLRLAKVYFRLIGDKNQVAESETILNREKPNFQREVAKKLQAKFCPVLRFEYGVADKRDEIDELFDNLRKPKHQWGD